MNCTPLWQIILTHGIAASVGASLGLLGAALCFAARQSGQCKPKQDEKLAFAAQAINGVTYSHLPPQAPFAINPNDVCAWLRELIFLRASQRNAACPDEHEGFPGC